MADFEKEDWHPAQRRKRLLRLAAGAGALAVLAGVAWKVYDVMKARRLHDELLALGAREAQAADVRKRAEERSKAWRAAILAFGDDDMTDANCTAPLSDLLSTKIGGGLDRLGIDLGTGTPVAFLTRTELGGTPISPSGKRAVRRALDPDPGSQPAGASAVDALRWTVDLTIVVDAEAAPGAADFDAGTFRGGARAAHAYVFDYAAGRVVCAGRFVAHSSGTIENVDPDRGQSGFQGAADFDLDSSSVEKAVESLRAAKR